jgi:hypothetical protein
MPVRCQNDEGSTVHHAENSKAGQLLDEQKASQTRKPEQNRKRVVDEYLAESKRPWSKAGVFSPRGIANEFQVCKVVREVPENIRQKDKPRDAG